VTTDGTGLKSRITNGDAARFLVAALDDDTYLRRTPAVSN
jgi:hypothetical protein